MVIKIGLFKRFFEKCLFTILLNISVTITKYFIYEKYVAWCAHESFEENADRTRENT